MNIYLRAFSSWKCHNLLCASFVKRMTGLVCPCSLFFRGVEYQYTSTPPPPSLRSVTLATWVNCYTKYTVRV